ncbi:hypothetical protein J437_LFUL006885 [Ladona fulva]|uniref:DNA helicase Pif1-like 2B domain-containing protein n=1 Tax=Ladona fulva TaxID=123851 RepID=A0A8K0KG60_LADFU|nr:hypothetical protein J437_LFUL006885 [Ladona fulva]
MFECLKQSLKQSSLEVASSEESRIKNKMRGQLSDDEEARHFAEKFLGIGEGTHPLDCVTAQIELTNDLSYIVNSPDELIVYRNIVENYTSSNWLFERAIIAVRNEVVDDINLKIKTRFLARKEYINQSIQWLMQMKKSMPGMPSHCLRLKIVSLIILLRNLDSPRLCNGTRMNHDAFEAKIKFSLTFTELPFQFKRLQFPIRSAFSVTINRAQGQKLRFRGINLKNHAFLTVSYMWLAPEWETHRIYISTH